MQSRVAMLYMYMYNISDQFSPQEFFKASGKAWGVPHFDNLSSASEHIIHHLITFIDLIYKKKI